MLLIVFSLAVFLHSSKCNNPFCSYGYPTKFISLAAGYWLLAAVYLSAVSGKATITAIKSDQHVTGQ